MPQWFVNGQRVHRRRADGSIRNGTIEYARGDYSDVRWDDDLECVEETYNDSVTKTPAGEALTDRS